MKKIILFPILFITLCSFGNNKRKEVDVISYNLEMKLDTISQKLDIQTEIRIDNPGSVRIIKFLFSDLIKINNARLNGKNLIYSQRKDTLFAQVENNKKLKLILNYSLPVDSFRQDKIYALTRAMKWCPFIYDNISKFNSIIIVPKGYKVYSSGKLKNYNESNSFCRYEFLTKYNSGFPLIISPVGYYHEIVKKQNGVKIKYCFHNQDSVIINGIIQQSLNSFIFCNQFIGKYNHSQLTYIEYPGFSCAQSLESIVLMGSRFIKYFGLHPEFRDWPSHETIHQWIGSGYFNSISKNKKNRWFIEESLTEYLRQEYVEKTYGVDSLKAEFKKTIEYYNKALCL